MTNKTFVEKAAEKVGYGLAMAEDVAGAVKTAIGSAAEALKKSPAREDAKKPLNKAAGTTPAKKAAKKSPAKKSPAKKSPAKKSPAKKSPAKKAPAKKAVPKKAAKKPPKKPAKKAIRSRR
jgi:hypothetical protein